MKTLIALGLFLISFASFAHTCHISLYDPYNRPYMNFYSQWDTNCQSAASRCYETIRTQRLDSRYYRCYTISMTEDPQTRPTPRPNPNPMPQPNPNPRPNPEPQPNPTPDTNPTPEDTSEHRRSIEVGETVIFQSKYWVVTSVAGRGFYNLKLVGGRNSDLVKDVARHYVALTRGCHQEICAKQSVIDMSSKQYVAVEGVDYHGKFITKNTQTGALSFDVDFSQVARTSGCLSTDQVGICTGNTVVARDNRYYKVVAIQPDRKVVLESEDNNRKLQFDIDPISLTVTR